MKKIFVYATMLFMPVLLFSATTEELFKKGEAAYKSKDYSTALDLFRQVVQAEPANAKYQYNLGLAARKLDKYEMSAKAFREAKRLDPDITFTKNIKDFLDKLAEMEQMAGLSPQGSSGPGDFAGGEKAYKDGDYAKAFELFAKVVSLEPSNAKYQYNLGLAARKLNRYAEAARAFQEAKKLDSSIGFTKNPSDFEEKLAEMVRLSSGNPESANARGFFDEGEKAYKNKDYYKAYEGFKLAVNGEPENAKYQYNLGLAARKLQNYPEALKAFQEAARLDPEIGFTNDKQGFKDKLEEAVRNAGTQDSGNDGQKNISLKDENVFPIFLLLLGGGGAAGVAYYVYRKRKNRMSGDNQVATPGTQTGDRAQDPYNDYPGTHSRHTTHSQNTHQDTASHSSYRDHS
jgi:tetratricopeptide (TPR) repeat protein